MSARPRGYENLVECPYNRSHQIENGRRFQIHLERCQKEYQKLNPNSKMTCPFNTTHLINSPEIQHHIDNCPDRILVDKFQNPIIDHQEATQKKKVVKMMPQASVEEADWDTEPPVPAYDPKKYCDTNNIMQKCNGMQPNERKAFRKQEHIRLGNIRETK